MGGDLRPCFEAGLRGDLPAVEAQVGALAGDPSAEARAWDAALRAMLWFGAAAPGGAGPVPAEAIAALAGASGEARAVAALACAHAVRAQLLAFDVEGLDGACALFARTVEGVPSAEAQGRWVVAQAWQRVVRGEGATGIEEVVRQATRDGHADLVIEAMAVRALAAANEGDLAESLRLARRASLMARTEAMPQLEYLAHLVLARLRRVTGGPHLATRILSALLQVASAPWRPWLSWELVLAHGRVGGPRPLPNPLATMLQAAAAGDRPAYDAAAAIAWNAVRGFAPLAHDLADVLGAVDPLAPAASRSAELDAFCTGLQQLPPRGLQGVCGDAPDEQTPLAWVMSARGFATRRVLAPGAGLARLLGATGGYDTIDGRQLRTDSTIAVLALAGAGGLDEDELFRTLYGFAYEAVRHQSVRAVLYGRVRKRLGTAASLERTDGRVRLEHDAVLLVPDPRCTPPAELRILRVLAECRQAGARDVAATLGIPLRTAQDALRRLAEDGALRAERHAKGLHYFLEDTTFSEPTRRGRS